MLNALAEAARRAGANVISQARYRFGHNSPAGFTAIVLLDESHCSAHSYASEGLLAIDIFTCGSASPQAVLAYLREIVDLGEVNVREIPRFRSDEAPPRSSIEVAEPLIPT
jgi:S-adenosylmethionine decarboxylase